MPDEIMIHPRQHLFREVFHFLIGKTDFEFTVRTGEHGFDFGGNPTCHGSGHDAEKGFKPPTVGKSTPAQVSQILGVDRVSVDKTQLQLTPLELPILPTEVGERIGFLDLVLPAAGDEFLTVTGDKYHF